MLGNSRSGTRPLRVLVLGAEGLIGAAVCDALLSCGHVPVRGVRPRQRNQPAGADSVYVDFTRDRAAADWLPRLDGVDGVVNAVGIFAERGAQTFQRIHQDAPRALAAACRAAGIGKVVQISALGADAQAQSPFHQSKRAGDDALLAQVPTAAVVQPSLVFAPRGASSRLLLTLAMMPLVMLPGSGRQPVQPIHVDDLASAVVRLLEAAAPAQARIAAVGPQALALADYLAILRRALGCGRQWRIVVPTAWLMRIGRLTGGRWLDPDALAMLERGNTADAAPIARLLGRAPRPPDRFVPDAEVAPLRRALAWQIGTPLARLSVAAVWLVTGIVSLGLYPKAQSLALLAQVGLHGMPAQLALYGATALDLAYGVAMLVLRRRWLCWLQIATIVGYTVIISIALPQFWLHPFGPILKNLPMLALLGILCATERR